MNFLAHLFLSGDEEHLVVGNFLGDFLNNRQVARLPRPIQEGVRLHRMIDSFTDQHPVVRKSARRLRPVHGRYAPVILDVFQDFLLAGNWGRYTEMTLSDFTTGIYEILENHIHLFPDSLQKRLPLMIADDWLVRYGTEEGLRFTFSRMKLRSSHPEFFENAVESLREHFAQLDSDFNVFFPDAIEAVKNWNVRSE